MDIKFVTNKIPTKTVTFEDLFNKYASEQAEGMEKTAAKEEDEAESSGQPEWEGKQENNNKPECCEETKKASGSNEDDKADSSGQLDVEPLHQKGESTGECKDEDDKADKEASTNGWVKISALNPKTKKMLYDYYRTIYPESYAAALTAEH